MRHPGPHQPRIADRAPHSSDSVVRGWGQLLSILPYQLGFHPSESLVLVRLIEGRSPTGWGIGALARLDRDVTDDTDLLDTVVHRMRAAATQAVVIVDYRPWSPTPEGVDRDEPLRRLVGACARHEVAVVTALVVEHEWWREADERSILGSAAAPGSGPECASTIGMDADTQPRWLEIPPASEVPATADLVLAGIAPLHDRTDLEAIIQGTGPDDPGDPHICAAWERVLVEFGLDEIAPSGLSTSSHQQIRSAWTAFLTDPAGCSVNDLVIVAASLRCVGFRDALLSRALPAWEMDPKVAALTAEFDPGLPERELLADVERNEYVLALRRLADLPPRARVPLAATLAMLGWAQGWAPWAALAVGVVRAIDPAYRLGFLAAQLLAHMVPPPTSPG